MFSIDLNGNACYKQEMIADGKWIPYFTAVTNHVMETLKSDLNFNTFLGYCTARKENQNNKKMTVEEAGRKDGVATSRNHDKEFYQEIGQKGGETTARNHDQDFYEEIGHKGGEARANQSTNNSNKMSQEKAGRKGGRARANKQNDH
ncbi:general stress protein [Oceanobacillus alkalisoli]|uniref:general stress protein n=1 Tax=Oceanobacillus alkalisoli TaxID=2925113 RepID=UPI00287377BB|nr:general stress protein [Oceanobacillus alkalisoli]